MFAWKTTNMTGVPRHITEHRLNVQEGCPPVRQKKRGQAADKNQAIQEEVEKLVDAGIMKEVHYHSWLSNSIMMPFGLRNVGATYQRLVDKAFHKQIGRNLEINGKLASLNRFLAKSTEKSLPFLKTLKKCTKKSGFHWTGEFESAFKQMKQLIAKLPMLTTPEEKEELIPRLERSISELHTNGKIGLGTSTCQQASEKILPSTPNYSGHGPTHKASVFKTRNFIVERPEEDSLDTPMDIEEGLSEPWILIKDSITNGYEKPPGKCGFPISGQPGQRNLHSKGGRHDPIPRKGKGTHQWFQNVHRPVSRNPQQKLNPITSPWPFYKWGIDIARPFPEGPGEIISNNGKQFRDNPFKDWCEKLCIRQRFASVKHPQANGLVERANRSLGKGIKARLDARSKNWMEEISHVLWAHRTMIKSSNRDTPFSLTYGTEAVIPVEIGMPTLRTAEVDMVRSTRFKPGDLVYRSNDASRAEEGGKLCPKWEGPYEVTEALGNGVYKLRDRDGKQLSRT
ncbi:reverse transcriptase domain-containing protein [Tanacetum coccineum]